MPHKDDPRRPPGHRRSAWTAQRQWRTHGLLALILFLAVALRFAYCLNAHNAGIPWFEEPALGTDQEMYLSTARRIVSLGSFGETVDANPLYPLVVLPAFYAMSGQEVLLTHFAQGAVLGLATVWLVYLLGVRLCGRGVGLAAAFLAAVHPPFIVYDCALLSEPVINVTVLAALLSVARLRDGRGGWRVPAAGVTTGVAALAKPAMLIIAPLVPIMLLAGRGARWRVVLIRTALVGLVAAVTIAPVTIRNYRAVGEFIPIRSNAAQVFLMGNNPTATGHFAYPQGEWKRREEEAVAAAMTLRGRDAARFRLALEFIRTHPGHFLRLTGSKLVAFFSPYEEGNNLSVTLNRQMTFLRWPVFPPFGWILGFAVLAPVIGRRGCRGAWLLYTFIGLHAVSTALFVVVSRYRLPSTLCLMILAGVVVIRLSALARSGRWVRTAVALAAALACVAAIHYHQIYRWLVPIGQPNGFVTTVPDGVQISDTKGPMREAFTVLSQPEMVVEKTLMVPARLVPARRARIRLACRAPGGARCVAELNGQAVLFDVPPKTRGFIAVNVPGDWVIEGANVIRIRALAGSRIDIWVSDRFRFGRSRWRDREGRWHTRYLDTTTHIRRAAEHLLAGEYAIRLVILRGTATRSSP